MRDLILSVFIGSVVVVGATDFAGVTNVFHGQSPATAIRDAVPVQDLPSLPALPSLPSIPDARAMLGGATATPTPTPAPQVMYVAHTNGSGVRPRLACADDAPGQGIVAEGTSVTIVRQGASECPGWALVTTGKIEFWVLMKYLDAAAPKTSSGGKPVDAGKPPAAPVTPPKANGDSPDLRERVEQERKRQEAPESPTASAPEPPAPTAAPTAAATSSPAPAEPPSERRPKHTPAPTPTEEPKEDEN